MSVFIVLADTTANEPGLNVNGDLVTGAALGPPETAEQAVATYWRDAGGLVDSSLLPPGDGSHAPRRAAPLFERPGTGELGPPSGNDAAPFPTEPQPFGGIGLPPGAGPRH